MHVQTSENSRRQKPPKKAMSTLMAKPGLQHDLEQQNIRSSSKYLMANKLSEYSSDPDK